MAKNICTKVMDYLFARDIYAIDKRCEMDAREIIMDKSLLEKAVRSSKRIRYLNSFACSLLPNLTESLGIGLSLYHQDFDNLITIGVFAETIRILCRANATLTSKYTRKASSSAVVMQEMRDELYGDIRRKLDEGEEWKEQQM